MKQSILVLTAAVCMSVMDSSASLYACDCHTANVISMSVPTYGGFTAAQHMFAPVAMAGPMIMESHATVGFNGGGNEPLTPTPPGTVGQTYIRRSHPVPSDEHPRTGMLAVRENGTVPFLSVQNMGGIKMKSGIWLFESHRPLDPGACQIVRVEARYNEKDIEPYETRFVRLIPGRIVYLDF